MKKLFILLIAFAFTLVPIQASETNDFGYELSTSFEEMLEELEEKGFGEKNYENGVPIPELEVPEGFIKDAKSIFQEKYGDLYNNTNIVLEEKDEYIKLQATVKAFQDAKLNTKLTPSSNKAVNLALNNVIKTNLKLFSAEDEAKFNAAFGTKQTKTETRVEDGKIVNKQVELPSTMDLKKAEANKKLFEKRIEADKTAKEVQTEVKNIMVGVESKKGISSGYESLKDWSNSYLSADVITKLYNIFDNTIIVNNDFKEPYAFADSAIKKAINTDIPELEKMYNELKTIEDHIAYVAANEKYEEKRLAIIERLSLQMAQLCDLTGRLINADFGYDVNNATVAALEFKNGLINLRDKLK